jgi:hypothetical protein
MGRKHRREPERNADRPAFFTYRDVENFRGEEWVVQTVTGSGATKTYRCPGCDHEIRPATPHVVAYPAQGLGGVEARRHWHKPCWAARHHRGPRH